MKSSPPKSSTSKAFTLAAGVVSLAMFGIQPAVVLADSSANGKGAAARMQAQGPDRIQLERRFESVGTLIEKSSGAQQIEASGNPVAIERREQAREKYAEARAAFDANELGRAAELLSAASVVMFEAVRLGSPEMVTGKKTAQDFSGKRESVEALLAAHDRIVDEKGVKGVGAGSREAKLQIEKLLGEADRLAATGDLDAARIALDQAYLAAKASVSSMRMGDTLVRSLDFATKEEEYDYEIDRNETHRMLVTMLLEGKPANPDVPGLIEAASGLRSQAEAAAAGGDFEGAIELLERSTAELVRAIRSSGIFIPG